MGILEKCWNGLQKTFMVLNPDKCQYVCLKVCVCYIFPSLFLSLSERTCQTRKNVFYFTSKALFVLEKIKCLRIKQKIHFTELLGK